MNIGFSCVVYAVYYLHDVVSFLEIIMYNVVKIPAKVLLKSGAEMYLDVVSSTL